MEGVYSNKPVGELVRGPTRATRVGERQRGPTREREWESQKRPHMERSMGVLEGGPMQSKYRSV